MVSAALASVSNSPKDVAYSHTCLKHAKYQAKEDRTEFTFAGTQYFSDEVAKLHDIITMSAYPGGRRYNEVSE